MEIRDIWRGRLLFEVPESFVIDEDSARCVICGRSSRLSVRDSSDQHDESCSIATVRWTYSPPVVISYSGGAQSKYLAVRALEGGFYDHPDRRLRLYPGHWVVGCADTGSEKRERYGEHLSTYEEIDQMREMCEASGVPFLLARRDGPALHEYLIGIEDSDATRVDHPPFYVKSTSRGGRMVNRCTREWKIYPMRRRVREWLKANGYPLAVRQWIGLAADEESRVREFVHDVQYWRCEFPLFRLGVARQDSRDWLSVNGYTLPNRSLCTHCPNQSPAMFAALRGADAAVAIAVDRAVRDLSDQGVMYTGYLSNALIPVEDLIGRDASDVGTDDERWYCASGRCGI